MIRIPDEAVEAAARSICFSETGYDFDDIHESGKAMYVDTALAALRAAINAWPGAWTSVGGVTGMEITLPLPQENSDD